MHVCTYIHITYRNAYICIHVCRHACGYIKCLDINTCILDIHMDVSMYA